MRNFVYICILLLTSVNTFADVKNPVAFIGQFVLGSDVSEPLFTDANNALVSGEPGTTYFQNTNSITTASTTYVNMTDLVSGSLTGTYQVQCRTSVTHATNNADIFIAVGLATANVANTIAQARPFIQGGVTPSLSVPMTLATFGEVTAAAQAISCMWRTTAGTATSPANSRAMMLRRVR